MTQFFCTLACEITGIEIQFPHFPGSKVANFQHPVFTVPLKTLWKNVPIEKRLNWSMTENALLSLALLYQTGVVFFREGKARIKAKEELILLEEQERIFSFVRRRLTLPEEFELPHVILQVGSTTENAISRLPDFLYVLHEQLDQFQEGQKEKFLKKKNAERLLKLERFIRKNCINEKNRRAFGKILAEWAAISADFETYDVPQLTPYGIKSLTEYWKQIIFMTCAGEDKLWQIPAKDFQELLEHLDDNLNRGTYYAAELFRFLVDGAITARDSFGLTDERGNFRFLDEYIKDKECTTYAIMNNWLSPEETVAQEAKSKQIFEELITSMKLEAPKEKPTLGKYSSKLEFLRALSRWELQNAN